MGKKKQQKKICSFKGLSTPKKNTDTAKTFFSSTAIQMTESKPCLSGCKRFQLMIKKPLPLGPSYKYRNIRNLSRQSQTLKRHLSLNKNIKCPFCLWLVKSQFNTAKSLESYIYLLLNTEMLTRYRLFFFERDDRYCTLLFKQLDR